MKLVKNSIATKLAVGFGICVLLMVVLVWFNFAALQKLNKLYRETIRHTTAMHLAKDSQYIGETLGMIIGHAVINRDLAQSNTDWAAAKKESLTKLQKVAAVADIPEEQAIIRETQAAFDDIVRIYEQEMLPLLMKGTIILGPLSEIDARLDTKIKAINLALVRMAKIESDESMGASREFHAVLAHTIGSGLTISLFGVVTALSIAIVSFRRIVRPLSEMTRVVQEMEQGNYLVELRHRSDDESGVLADAFRNMAGQVEKRAAELEDVNKRLHHEIDERKLAEEEVRRLNVALERWVAERTADLAATVNTLQQEVVERSRAEEALRGSEERYALAVMGANDGIWDWDLEADTTHLSPRLKAIFGYEDAELSNRADEWRTRIYHEDYNSVMATIDEYLNGRIPVFQVESRIVHRDGNPRWVLCRGVCLRDEAGKAYRMAGSLTDITSRKLAEEALKESEKLLRVVIETLPVGIWVCGRGGESIVMSNKAGKTIWCGKQECDVEMINEFRGWRPGTGKRLQKDEWPLTRAISCGRAILNEIIEIECSDGSRKIIANSAVPIMNKDREIIAAVEVIEDITERSQAELKLKASHEQLRNLSAHLQSAQEKERARIARDIHDELGQLLTVLKIDLSLLSGSIHPTEQALIEKTRLMTELIDTAINTVRRIATDLRPKVLDFLGLTAAIKWHAQQFQSRSGIVCQLNIDTAEIEIDQERSTNIYRIFQEALTNIMRHADASSINVILTKKGDEVQLEIVDNGKGIDRKALSDPKSVGLTGMRERALLMGGKMSISGARGKGTKVKVTIPLMDKEESDDQNSHS